MECVSGAVTLSSVEVFEKVALVFDHKHHLRLNVLAFAVNNTNTHKRRARYYFAKGAK